MLLQIKNLSAGYGKFPVLKGVNIEVNRGEIVVLIGPNGAGKSTVLKSIFKIAAIYEGEIIFKNQKLKKISRHDLIRLGISYVPQGRVIFPNLTVEENLLMGGFILDNELLKQKKDRILEEFPHLKKKLNLIADVLSGGEQQMLVLARGLITDPELLLLDEPSLGLSPKIQKEIFNKILEIKNLGISILLVEQNAKKACEIADRIYLLKSGKEVLFGGKEILSHPLIQKVYLGG
ncbi:MAG: ABC transporter ATP-binding protein [Patescibacteria group bacterium]|nr:ABC transporter ATP-binding protein [Patescibacteria group bacterium]